jgi:hypothetical protein
MESLSSSAFHNRLEILNRYNTIQKKSELSLIP